MATRKTRPRRITLQVLGRPEDEGHVRLSSFVKQLETLRNALRSTERVLSGDDDGIVGWRIVDLSHKSPATVVLEEVVPTDRPRSQGVSEHFIQSMKAISRAATFPERHVGSEDLAILEAYREFASLAHGPLDRVTVRSGRTTVAITARFQKNLEAIIGPDEHVAGTVSGVLEAINIHNTLRCNIYPIVGAKKIVCGFAPGMKAQVIAGLGSYVTVAGTLKYKQWASFPHAADVEDITVHPDDAPLLSDLRGIAPGLTGGVPAEDFVRSSRDEEW